MDQQNQQLPTVGNLSPEPPDQANLSSSANPEENPGFTIDSKQIESAVKDEMDDRQEPDLDRVLEAGNELLFGEETHYQLMDQIKDSKNMAADLGNGAFNMMTLLIKQGGNTMPGDIVLPSGIILMARASEFINESGMAQVTDDNFEEAAHIFSVKIMNTYDPEFKAKMQQHSGQAASDQRMPPEEPQGAMPQGGGGLLNMTEQTGV